MKAISKVFFTLYLAIAFGNANGQINDQNIRQQALRKALVDSTLVFGKWTANGGTETHLKYLGQVTTEDGQVFKILNSVWYWGLSHRATTRILVFNSKNQYVGNYRLTLPSELPMKMEDEKLFFRNTDEQCDNKLTTTVNLKNGLPKTFFRKCRGEYGDTYSFENN